MLQVNTASSNTCLDSLIYNFLKNMHDQCSTFGSNVERPNFKYNQTAMAETSATILIPDISGFTEFMTHTELSHGSFAISMLINAMIDAVGDEYQVSEVEGDAVLLFRKGPAPTATAIRDCCLRIFNAFHYRRKWMQQHAICPCHACKDISNLTLKFVAHHGPVAEIKLGGLNKLSGTDVIIAHRLLKNSLPSHEYMLLTEKLLLQHKASEEETLFEGIEAFDEYESIGKVNYRYRYLDTEKEAVPDPPQPETSYRKDDTPFKEIEVRANYLDAFMLLMNIPERADWVPSLLQVEQDLPAVFLGSVHRCSFYDCQATVSPLYIEHQDQRILYAERFTLGEDVSFVYEYIFEALDASHTNISYRLMVDDSIKNDIYAAQENKARMMIDALQQKAES